MTDPQSLVTELAASGDPEIGISWANFSSIVGLNGLTLPGEPDQCADCHGFGGDHESWCDIDRCGICGWHGNRCVCDAAYERESGK